ncbi:MAG: protein-L-isoaspartate(D-aspartate) O-methyltransferase [Psychromonas sp.]
MKKSTLQELMVSEQIESRGINDKAVLQAMKKVPRHLFVKESLVSEAYCDYPLPIGMQQTISQPYIVALMSEYLQLRPEHKVLEIGTGCGYQTAVLAEIVDRVYTIEIVPQLAKLARNNLLKLNYHNIYYKVGDGLSDWQSEAPFDRIIVTAAPEILPMQLLQQLKVNGSMVIPVGIQAQTLYRIVKRADKIEQQKLASVRFVTMTGKMKNEK